MGNQNLGDTVLQTIHYTVLFVLKMFTLAYKIRLTFSNFPFTP